MTGLPRDIRYLTATKAVCTRCNTVMQASQPWQLVDLTRRHAAESHKPRTAISPPSGGAEVLPTG